MSTTVHLLANPATRRGRAAEQIQAVTELLRTRCETVVDISGTTPHETEQAAKELASNGAERLVVVGGDGMVHIAVQAVAQTDTILGIVPLGTGNDFAGGIGLPTEKGAAVEAALGDPTPIDLMQIGDRWAASVATLGFSASVNARANDMGWPTGSSRYSVATLRELPRLSAMPYVLTIDEVTHELPAVVVTVANTSDFGGGMRITPSASPADGTLDVTIVGDVGRLELLRWFRKVFSGTHLAHPKVSTLSGQSITVDGPNTELWADGELVTTTPVTVKAVPGALKLAGVPRDRAD